MSGIDHALVAVALLTAGPALAGDKTPKAQVELDQQLENACKAAVSDHGLVLLAFSADWCGDCRQLDAMTHQPPLQQELENWQMVTVDVGRFDRHKDLLQAFQVRSIARWAALAPSDCSKPVTEWPRLKVDTLEPKSRPDSARTPADVAQWLAEARARKPAPQETP